jgi:Mrp family chromosome partitioning ATPase
VREGPAPLCAQVAGELASHTSQSVCAVDADFRTPQLNSAFAVPEARGLSDALLGDTSGVAGLATQVSEAMWLLPAGFGGTAALPYLASESFHEQILQLRAAFEYVLVEAPPADEHGHAVAVAGATDGVVLVIDARATRREVARRVVGRLQTSGVPVLGAVLTNRTYPIPEVLYRLL